jgi:hypothetical protein
VDVKRAIIFSLISLLCIGLLPVQAQADTGSICVSTYADSNGNGTRDGGETVLPGVNVQLLTDSVIVATHITSSSEEQACFENLAPGIYTVMFTNSPTFQATTANEGTVELSAGQRLTITGFGAIPIPADEQRARAAAQIVASEPADEPLETSVRLMLATGGSMLMMLFMIGVGAVVFGTMSGRRRSTQRAK